MSRMGLALALVVVAAGTATAGAHTRTYGVGQSSRGTGYEASKVWDGDYQTNWASAQCTSGGGACYEWIAFWWDTFRTTDYLRIVPSSVTDARPFGCPAPPASWYHPTINCWTQTRVVNAPTYVNVYYSYGGVWNFLTTVNLPSNQNDIPLSGLLVKFNAVTANGILLTTNAQRPDLAGDYYFALADLYAGDSTIPDTTISTNSKTCSVYGDTATKVLDNDSDNLAYDFNVTKVGSSDYVAVFHSEAFGQSAGSAGDSTATITSSSPLSFGARTGGNPGDYIVAAITDPYPGGNPWPYMSGGSAFESQGGIGQGGNPHLIQRTTDGLWTLFYINVTDQGDQSNWRHYLMVGHPDNVLTMTNSQWWSLANSGTKAVPQDYWQYFPSGSLATDTSGNRRSYQPMPARWHDSYDSSMKTVASSHQTSSFWTTNGLIGNIGYGPITGNNSTDKMYFFNIDFHTDGTTPKTYVMETFNAESVNWWVNRSEVFSGWAQKIAYSPYIDRWMVLANCVSGGRNDLCLQFSSSNSVGSVSSITPASTTYAAGIGKWFRDSLTLGVMEQYGILKNNRGQLPNESTFYIYLTERSGTGGANGLYGMDMYAVKVSCVN